MKHFCKTGKKYCSKNTPAIIVYGSLLVVTAVFLLVFHRQYHDFMQNSHTQFQETKQEFYIPMGEEVKEEVKAEDVKVFDFLSDDSFQKYVDPQVSFTDIAYVPADMRSLSGAYIRDMKGDLQLRAEASEAFEALAKHFFEDIGEKIDVVSSYRSYSYQAGIKARGCPDHLCAKAGHSEHQSGLAIDVWSASTQEYWLASPRLMGFFEWFQKHAHSYGFHNSYQNGVEIDGYAIEPWHWRYVGVDFATFLHEKNITFAQHYYEYISEEQKK